MTLNQDAIQTSRGPRLARPKDSFLPKSASFTYLPVVKESAYTRTTTIPVRIRRDTSSEDLTAPVESADVSPPDSSGWDTPSEDAKGTIEVVDGASARLEVLERSSYAESSSSSEKRRSAGGSSKDVDLEAESDVPDLTPKSFAKRLGRRMSLVGSRTPSRSPTRATSQSRDSVKGSENDLSSPRASRTLFRKADKSNSTTAARPELGQRRSTFGGERTENATSKNSRPSKTFLPKSFSTDKLHSVVESPQEDAIPLPSPRLFNTERNSSSQSLSMPKKRDELWNIFRSLDGDFTKFSSKSTPFKANVIRQSLLPFLRNYADHASNYNLRAEDLDRRVAILNKWWVGLLELMHGKNNQSMSGTDRPTILDALSALMDRPEWRPSPSVYCPLARRRTDDPLRKKSSGSIASAGSEFLAESVLHNVRNLFVQNLTAQMAFVADKMSLRSASASLITFCGKAIAWAFFFCPGVADVLVRMWKIEPGSLKRVLQTNDISKFDNLADTAADIGSAFPPAIRTLAFNSFTKMIRALREPAEMPPGSTSFEMYGFWHDRWLGRESDMFFVFVKHFFILSHEYLPVGADQKQKMASPCMLLVQAQVLSNLDSTINRDVSSSNENNGGPSPTFDDFLGGPDAVVSSLPILPPNASRIMSENRLIMLIRDFLSDRVADHSDARQLFAVSFCSLLTACASGTSSFNQAACYTLCDFLEEAFVILTRYEQSPACPGPVIDTNFWTEVFRLMLGSHNTVTEIRVFAFMYTTWTQLCFNQQRKQSFCIDLLLSQDLFEHGFTHWCPMVRAYYMRLLCWRMARHDENADELDNQILTKLMERLRTIWSYQLYERGNAEAKGITPRSTAPCNPAPGRRFIVVRTDTQVVPGGSFMAFNGIVPPTPAGPATRESRPTTTTSEVTSEKDAETGLRGFLRGIMGGQRKRSQSRDRRSVSGSRSPAKGQDDSANRPRDRQSLSRASSQPPAYRNYCFKFSLEVSTRVNGRNVAPSQMRLAPPKLPLAAMKYIQEQEPEVPTITPEAPSGSVNVQYIGRALAEWTVIVNECQGFFDRRKQEGIPSDKEVETPTLAVEVFKRTAREQ